MYRHEWKHEIDRSDRLAIRQRLRAAAQPDPHAQNGRYLVRSLYFDTPTDRALREKVDGVSRREKFRLRYYNGDRSLIHLEKKSKRGGLGTKESALLSAGEVQALLDGDLAWMARSGRTLVWELYQKMHTQLLAPKTLVDYVREPFVYPPGNVRVTLDYDLRTSLNCRGFLDPDCLTLPARDAPDILEVKWDAYLPEVIRMAVQLPRRRAAAFSKYAACRMYG